MGHAEMVEVALGEMGIEAHGPLAVVNGRPRGPPQNGFLLLDRAKFAEAFAVGLDPAKAAFMADSQIPWGLDALNGAVTVAAWKAKASWYVVAKDDRMIPPDAQRAMSKRAGSVVVELEGSHAIYVSQPGGVAELIEAAAETAKASGI